MGIAEVMRETECCTPSRNDHEPVFVYVWWGELLQENRRFKLMLNPLVNIQIFFSHSNLKTTQMSFISDLIKHWEDTRNNKVDP